MHDVRVLGPLHHEGVMHHCGKDNAQAVDNVQHLEPDGVIDPWLSQLVGLQPEEQLDAYSSDHHEGGIEDLRGNSNMRQGLVPIVQRGVC